MKVSLLGHLFEQDRKFSSEERESDRRHHKERRRGFRGKERKRNVKEPWQLWLLCAVM